MKKIRVGIGSDHFGVFYKHELMTELEKVNIDVVDLEVGNKKASDYPDVATNLADAMFYNNVERGILIGETGIGMSIAANKFMGLRAAICHDDYSVKVGVEQIEMNVLCLGQKVIELKLAIEMVHQFLKVEYSSVSIYRRRVAKILEIEANNMKEVL